MRTPRNIWQIHYRHTGNSDRLMETSYNIEAAMIDNHSPSLLSDYSTHLKSGFYLL